MKKFDDKITRAILAVLRDNARISWQALGRKVHLSGQAVAERVRQMSEAGVISGFTLRQNNLPRYFIDIKMAHNRFAEFEAFLLGDLKVESLDRTNGDYCYHIVYIADSRNELDEFLNRLLPHGRCRVAGSLKRIK